MLIPRDREFKAGRIENALEMFSKGLRYMDEHPVVPEDQPEEVKNTFESLYVLPPPQSPTTRSYHVSAGILS